MSHNEFDPIHLFHNNPLPRVEAESQATPNEEEGDVDDNEAQTQHAEQRDEVNEDLTLAHENPVHDTRHEGQRMTRKELCSEDRVAAYAMLLQRSVNGKLRKNTTREVAEFFQVNIRSIQRLWKRGKESEKRDVFQLALTSVRAASVELNSFANAIPGIPTMDD